MDYAKKLQVSKIIRIVMRLHGKRMIYNNIYPSGVRTVKCYQGENDHALVQDINNMLTFLGVKFKIRRLDCPHYMFRSPGSLIIKLVD